MMWSPSEFVGLIYWCPVERRRKEVALRSVQVEARVVDLCASVQLTQRYVVPHCRQAASDTCTHTHGLASVVDTSHSGDVREP
jgi:hypothetical protein